MNTELNNITNNLLKEQGILLYVSEFGSKLYGTNTAKSDKDYKGLFLPFKEKLILQEKCNSVQYSSGNNDSKNSNNDIDIQLWSIQYWFELLRKGDTNAIDLLFSMYSTHNANLSYLYFKDIMSNYKPIELLDVKSNKAYIAYAYHQAKKYGLKGSRLAKLKEVINYFDNDLNDVKLEDIRLKEIVDKLLVKFYDVSLFFSKQIDDKNLLYILGKGFNYHIKLSEMYDRLVHDYNNYGERAKLAEENKGIDWKALSHAVRCLDQMNELIDNEFITYPLKTRQNLIDIKEGKLSWEEVENIIINKLNIIDSKIETLSSNNKLYDNHKNIILSLYEKHYN